MADLTSQRYMPFDGFDDWLQAAATTMHRRTTRSTPSDARLRAADRTYQAHEDLLETLASATWDSRRGVEAELGDGRRAAFRALDTAIGLAMACLRLLEPGQLSGRYAEPPHDVAYALVALGVQAQAVSHEIQALIRAGFGIGAHARWRSLYEVFVVAETLAVGNRHTYTRFVKHRWIMLARDFDRQAVNGPTHQDWPEVARMRRQLIRRFGPECSGTYGWAAELTKRRLNTKRPRFQDLERLVWPGKGHLNRVLEAHHAVHMDSYGVLLRIGQDDRFHPGPSYDGLAAACFETTLLLGDIVSVLLNSWNKFAHSKRMTDVQALADAAFGRLSFVALANATQSGDIDESFLVAMLDDDPSGDGATA